MFLRWDSFTVVLCLTIVALCLGAEPKKQADPCYKPCRVKSTPVCGNDGRNYTTRCHLSVARCRARKFGQLIYLNNTGYCRSSRPLSSCAWNCTTRRQPICASIGGSKKATYRNLCLFKKEKCLRRKRKLKPIKVLSRKGSCSDTASCRKLSDCPRVIRPVCGTDGKTYKNICHLKVRNCVNKRKARGKKVKRLNLRHCGACGKATKCKASWHQKCPSINLCHQMLKALRKTPKSSSKPGGRSKKGTTKSGRVGSKNKLSKTKTKGKKRKNVYPKQKFMMCGSDGKTYPSICHLQVAQCVKRQRCQRLHLRHRGPCKN